MPVYKGFNAQVSKDGVDLGYLKEVTLDIDHSLEAYFEINSHDAVRLQEGPMHVTGKFSRAWIDINYLTLVSSSTLLEFDLMVIVDDTFALHIYDCKLKKGTVNIPADGFLMEDYEFVAKDFAVEVL